MGGYMVKKVALVGLNNFNNMGDQVIAETTQYLVQRDREDQIESYFVDISPYDSYCAVYLPLRFRIFNLFKKLEALFFGQNAPLQNAPLRRSIYYLQKTAWKIKLYKYYKQQLEKADAVVFSGGGFIKFRTQELNYLVDMIIQISMNKGIPVMMSAMGVEGYSQTDPRCQQLKTAINRPCVKVITTRDHLLLLNKEYIVNPSIITDLVGDPAFYSPECYQIEKKQSNVVGIGVIRSDIFLKYGIAYSENEVLKLYQEILMDLEKRKINWLLFSNGLTSDYQFGIKLLDSLGMDKRKYMPRPEETKDFVKMISEFDAIIGARLHACITAYSLDIPVIGLVWNEKLKLFGELIGKQDNYIEVEQLNAHHIVDSLERVRNDRYDIKQRNELKILTTLYIDKFLNNFIEVIR